MDRTRLTVGTDARTDPLLLRFEGPGGTVELNRPVDGTGEGARHALGVTVADRHGLTVARARWEGGLETGGSRRAESLGTCLKALALQSQAFTWTCADGVLRVEGGAHDDGAGLMVRVHGADGARRQVHLVLDAETLARMVEVLHAPYSWR